MVAILGCDINLHGRKSAIRKHYHCSVFSVCLVLVHAGQSFANKPVVCLTIRPMSSTSNYAMNGGRLNW